MASRKITHARFTLAAAGAALAVALAPHAARAGEDAGDAQMALARPPAPSVTGAQQVAEPGASRDRADAVTREEFDRVVQALDRIERDQAAAAQREEPHFTDAG